MADETESYVTVFRSRLRGDAGEAYEKTAAATEERARRAPGFVAFKSFAATDGERVSIVVFDSEQHHDEWRRDPFHLESQQLGRERFYEEYDITVAKLVHRRSWKRAPTSDEAT